MTLFKLVASSSAAKVADFSQQCSQRVSSVVGAYWNPWYGKQPLSALLRIISFTKMIVMKWIWICKVIIYVNQFNFLTFKSARVMILPCFYWQLSSEFSRISSLQATGDGGIRWQTAVLEWREKRPARGGVNGWWSPSFSGLKSLAFARVFSWYRYGELSRRLRYLQADEQLKRYVWVFIVNIFGL